MELSDYKSLCSERQSVIVSKENGRQHIAKNKDRNQVRQYQIDGVILKRQTACDYLVLNDDKKTAYFIELKGTDIIHAGEQLEAGANALKGQLSGYRPHFRIVATKIGTHKIHDSRYRKFEERCKKNHIHLEKGTVKMEETI